VTCSYDHHQRHNHLTERISAVAINRLYVVIGGDRVDLAPLASTHVLHTNGIASSLILDLFARAGAKLVGADEDLGTFVVEGDAVLLAAALRAARLTRRVRIEPAYHQVGGPPGDLWAPTGRVAVRFPAGWSRDRIDAILARRGLRMTEPIDEMPGGYFAVMDGDPIEAVRPLLEEDGALFAEPDFIQRMQRRTHTRPYTPTHHRKAP
jgi:hypothetical protein